MRKQSLSIKDIQQILEESSSDDGGGGALSDDDFSCGSSSSSSEDDINNNVSQLSNGSQVISSVDGDDWRDVDGSSLRTLIFTGQSGINASLPPEPSPFQIFSLFLDSEVLDLIVRETNKKAQSVATTWIDTTNDEMKKFLGLIIYFGLVPYPRYRLYWSNDKKYKNYFVRQVMTRNRFAAILRFIHFSDEITPENQTNRLRKVSDLISVLNKKFHSYYIPGEDLVIDESMVPFRGRLLFRQYLPGKSHKYGIKIYKLCDPLGYTFRLKVYAGKNDPTTGEGRHSDKVVMELLENYLNEGRTLVTDNFYTNLNLAKDLLIRNTHLVGTLRKFVKNVPKEILTPKRMKKGEVVGKESDGIVVGVWKDKREVRFLSTRHKLTMVNTGKMTKKKEEILKPEIIEFYNGRKQGVDVSDQLSSYFSPLKKTVRWFHKVAFFALLGTAVVNSVVLHKHLNPTNKIQISDFRASLVDNLVGIATDQPPPLRNKRSHTLEKTKERNKQNRLIRGRCVLCYNRLKIHVGRDLAQRKAPLCSTRCMTCEKTPFMCLPCFDEHNV